MAERPVEEESVAEDPIPKLNECNGDFAIVEVSRNPKLSNGNLLVDAPHVLWDREVSSVWPSRELFAAVAPGAYDLRLVLDTDTGDSESANLTVQIDAHH